MANNYKGSSHREQYESIAEKFGTTPEYVYSLAHGMKSTTHLDNEIPELLEKQHIVQVKRHRHHHKHHHSLISSVSTSDSSGTSYSSSLSLQPSISSARFHTWNSLNSICNVGTDML